MALPLLPLLVLGLAGGAAYAVSRKPKTEMTPDREIIFQTAMEKVEDPAKLKALADVFESQGLKDQAELLRKRANLRTLPPDVKEERRAAFQSGMASQNPEAVNRLADAFEAEGALGAASALRDYAKKLALAQERTVNPQAV